MGKGRERRGRVLLLWEGREGKEEGRGGNEGRRDLAPQSP